MRVKGLAWMGVRTDKFQQTVRFFREVMSLKTVYEEDGSTVHFSLPDGGTVEVFSNRSKYNAHFGSSPVVGFLIDDMETARKEIEQSGLELVGGIHKGEHGYSWQHFRGPDGNLYELSYDPTKHA
jgi:catechol 2,3-dioxygenase-like lactoylglutathione lyase family enzyme